MKAKKLLSTGLICMAVLNGGMVSAFADTVVNDSKGTDTTVTIIDAEDDKGIITDENGEVIDGDDRLTLEHVPSAYIFESTVKNKEYTLEAEMNDTIQVFNDRSKRNWEVRATIPTELTDTNVTKTVDVKGFDINGMRELTGEQIVFENINNEKEDNTGLLSKQVDSVTIKLLDADNKLKAGDVLKGTISYQLYLVTDVQ